MLTIGSGTCLRLGNRGECWDPPRERMVGCILMCKTGTLDSLSTPSLVQPPLALRLLSLQQAPPHKQVVHPPVRSVRQPCCPHLPGLVGEPRPGVPPVARVRLIPPSLHSVSHPSAWDHAYARLDIITCRFREKRRARSRFARSRG